MSKNESRINDDHQVLSVEEKKKEIHRLEEEEGLYMHVSSNKPFDE